METYNIIWTLSIITKFKKLKYNPLTQIDQSLTQIDQPLSPMMGMFFDY